MHALSTRHWSLAQDLELYDRLGVGRTSVALPKLADAGLDEAVAAITGRGLRVDGIYAGRAFDLGDRSSWQAVQDAMVSSIEIGRRLGATTLQTTGGSSGGRPFEWAADRLAEALEPVAEAARANAVRIALEPTRPQFAHVSFVHTFHDAVALANRLGLWLLPDSAHLWWEPGLADLLDDARPRIAALQLADLEFDSPVLERVVPGDGQLALGTLVAGLVTGGFEGPFELELIGRAIDDEGYESAISRSLVHVGGLLRSVAGPERA